MGIKQLFPGIYRIKGGIATQNSTPGFRVYDEKLIRRSGGEYRIWDPHRSKLSAFVLRGLKISPFRHDSNVLYLGASSGTTASHISDICKDGTIYCLEYSKRMIRNLVEVCKKKKNMVPILGDAQCPETYLHNIGGVDIIYQDISQQNQAAIMMRNSKEFAPKYAMLAIKSRSIDAVRSPKKVFRDETKKLRKMFDILQVLDLRPYDRDHVMVNLRTIR